MINTIYLVFGSFAYGGSYVLKAFASEEAADAFAQECRNYDESLPEYPNGEDQSAVDAWCRAHSIWQDRHPSGNGHYMYYTVWSIPIEQEAGDAK